MKSSDTGIIYTLDSLGNSFRLNGYNRLKNTEKMLPGFPIYCALETHAELKQIQHIQYFEVTNIDENWRGCLPKAVGFPEAKISRK